MYWAINNYLKSSWNCVDSKSSGIPGSNAVFFWISRLTVRAEKVLPVLTPLFLLNPMYFKTTKNSWQHWMSNVWTYILDNLCNLHTINVILAMNLMFKPFFWCHFSLFDKNLSKFASAASCLFWSNFFTCWSKKQPNQNQNSSFNLKLCFTSNFIKNPLN